MNFRDTLEQVAVKELPKEPKKKSTPRKKTYTPEEIEALLEQFGQAHSPRREDKGSVWYDLEQCPLCGHAGCNPAVSLKDGVPGFHCFHTDCEGKGWNDFIEPFAPELVRKTGGKPDLDVIAQTFADRYGHEWAYDTRRQCWRTWTRTHWHESSSPESVKLELDNLFTQLLHDQQQPVTSNSTLECIHRRARGKCKRDFTPVPGRVNYRNGTVEIDLKQHLVVTMHPHAKEDNLLYCLPYDYEAGSFPVIQQFLDETLPDLHAQQAYMAILGLALLGDVTMQYYLFLYGVPNAGKSTYLMLGNAVCGHTLSNYSSFAGDSLFSSELEGSRQRYTFVTRRLVCADELQPATFRAYENIIKSMTSHKGVPTRGMHKDSQEDNQWVPKVMMTANELPHYKDTSGALKRRTLFLYFPNGKKETEQDPSLFGKLLEEIAPFAHACLSLGLAALQRHYIPKSKTMKATSQEAATSGNALKTFIEDYCILHRDRKDEPDYMIPSTALHAAYKLYLEDNDHKVSSTATMTNELKEMNIGVTCSSSVKRVAGYPKPVRVLYGLRLRENEEPLAEERVRESMMDDRPLIEETDRSVVTTPPICNDHVTSESVDRYNGQNKDTGPLSIPDTGICNDVTSNSRFSAPTRENISPSRANTQKQSEESNMGIMGDLVVTSLQNGAKPPVEPVSACNEHPSPSLQGRYIVTNEQRCTTSFDGLRSEPHQQGSTLSMDASGHLWCEHCNVQREFMNNGRDQGYPAIIMDGKVKIPAGEANYHKYARTSGHRYVTLAVAEQKKVSV